MGTAYRDRKEKPRSTDVETDSIHDLLLRTKALRRRVALPAMIVSGVLALAGAWAHVAGAWSIFGRLADGGYYVSTFSMILAAMICGTPTAAIGAAAYLVLRTRMRAAWLAHYRAVEVRDAWPERDEWLERTSRRFG